MSWKTIAVLLVLVLGLGAYFYYDTYWLVPAREKAESVKGRLWTIEPKDVEARQHQAGKRHDPSQAGRGRLGNARAGRGAR